jgi:hypothetical protein
MALGSPPFLRCLPVPDMLPISLRRILRHTSTNHVHADWHTGECVQTHVLPPSARSCVGWCVCFEACRTVVYRSPCIDLHVPSQSKVTVREAAGVGMGRGVDGDLLVCARRLTAWIDVNPTAARSHSQWPHCVTARCHRAGVTCPPSPSFVVTPHRSVGWWSVRVCCL